MHIMFLNVYFVLEFYIVHANQFDMNTNKPDIFKETLLEPLLKKTVNQNDFLNIKIQ